MDASSGIKQPTTPPRPSLYSSASVPNIVRPETTTAPPPTPPSAQTATSYSWFPNLQPGKQVSVPTAGTTSSSSKATASVGKTSVGIASSSQPKAVSVVPRKLIFTLHHLNAYILIHYTAPAAVKGQASGKVNTFIICNCTSILMPCKDGTQTHERCGEPSNGEYGDDPKVRTRVQSVLRCVVGTGMFHLFSLATTNTGFLQ